MNLSCYPDWPVAQARWEAFWRGEHRGRCLMYLVAPRERQEALPAPEDCEQQYFDVDYLYRRTATELGNLHFLAEAVPATRAMLCGWLPAYGARLVLRPDTIWLEPVVEDWDTAPDWDDWNHPQFQRLCTLQAELTTRAAGQFIVGVPPTLPPNDLLSVLREPKRFLLDLVLEPERVQDALQRMTRSYLRQQEALREIMHRHFAGAQHHYPIWGPRLTTLQSDVSCMLSGAMFERFIVPELEAITAALGPATYHLDGPDAIRHLERLCDLPGIRIIQWVPGAGQPGSYEHWPQVFKYAQSRGKAIFLPVGPGQVEQAIREFRPDLTFMACSTGSYEEACRLLENAERWTAEYWG